MHEVHIRFQGSLGKGGPLTHLVLIGIPRDFVFCFKLLYFQSWRMNLLFNQKLTTKPTYLLSLFLLKSQDLGIASA